MFGDAGFSENALAAHGQRRGSNAKLPMDAEAFSGAQYQAALIMTYLMGADLPRG